MSGWTVKRGDAEYPVADGADELQRWAASGRIVSDDYVFNPVLGRWLYAKDIAEIAPFFTARKYGKAQWSGCGWSLLLSFASVALWAIDARGLALACGLASWITFGYAIYAAVRSKARPAVPVDRALRPPTSAPSAPPPTEIGPATESPLSNVLVVSSRRAGSRVIWKFVAAIVTLTIFGIIGLNLAFLDPQNEQSVHDLLSPAKPADRVIAAVAATPPVIAPQQTTAATATSAATALDVYVDAGRKLAFEQPCIAQGISATATMSREVALNSGYTLHDQCWSDMTPQKPARREVTEQIQEQPPADSPTAQSSNIYADHATKMYVREDCDHPSTAVYMPKMTAIREGYRPDPACYGTKRQ